MPVSLAGPRGRGRDAAERLVSCRVRFRPLDEATIERYLEREHGGIEAYVGELAERDPFKRGS